MSDFNTWFNRSHAVKTAYSSDYTLGAERGFKAGQASKQAEINMLKSVLQDVWTELDDRNSKEFIIEKCESIIKSVLI